MIIMSKKLSISTSKQFELVNITDSVKRFIRENNIKNGLCVVYTMHTTAAIIINEDEDGLKKDVIKTVYDLFKPGSGWKHDYVDRNAHSHLSSIYLGPSKIVPIINGKLGLGTWQQIFFVELDGPRSRSYYVTIIGE